MATMTILNGGYNMNSAINLQNPSSVYQSSTQVVLSDGAYGNQIDGSNLAWSDITGSWTSGTINTYTCVNLTWGNPVYSISGLNSNLATDTSYNGYDANGDSIKELKGMTGQVAYWLQGDDKIIGSGGADELNGYRGNDSLFGSAGSDVLSGGLGNDTLNGGTDWDIANYADLASRSGGYKLIVTGTMTNGTLAVKDSTGTTTLQTDTVVTMEEIRGSAYADYISTGSSGTQEGVQGYTGNDTIIGGAASDSDFVDYRYLASPLAKVVINLTNANSTVAGTYATGKVYWGSSTTASETDYLHNFNGVVGSAGNDSVTGSAGSDWVRGMSGNDTFNGGAGSDWIDYKWNPSALTITLLDDGAQTSINAGIYGTDTIINVENITGGTNNDLLIGNNLSNTLRGYEGNDTLNGGTGTEFDTVDYKWAAGAVNLTWNITTNTAVSSGADGVDSLINIEGVRGSANNDIFVVGASSTFFDGRGGADTLSFAQINSNGITLDLSNTGAQANGLTAYTLTAIEALTGTGLADNLTGDAYANTLNGGSGNDTLSGASGNDVIYGGLGNDNLTGGVGADTFLFNTVPNATTNSDTITDFSHTDDTIKLAKSVFTTIGTAGALAAGAFALSTDTLVADDRIIYNSTMGTLSYDADGSGAGAAVKLAIIGSGLAIDATDFVIY